MEIKDGFDTEEMVEARKNLAVAQKDINDLLKRAQDDVNPKTVWKIAGNDYMFEVPAATLKVGKKKTFALFFRLTL